MSGTDSISVPDTLFTPVPDTLFTPVPDTLFTPGSISNEIKTACSAPFYFAANQK